MLCFDGTAINWVGYVGLGGDLVRRFCYSIFVERFLSSDVGIDLVDGLCCFSAGIDFGLIIRLIGYQW